MTDAYTIHDAGPDAHWLINCDHATNRVPPGVADGDLGLPDAQMGRHIAYDIGALGVAKALAQALGGSLIAAGFSRLVVDPNRGEDDPTLIMQVYDGTIIPGNRGLDAAARAERIARFHSPYHAAFARLAARRPDTAIVAVHSFTPRLEGRRPRPWQIGLLSASDRQLTDALMHEIDGDPGFASWVAEVSGTPLCLGDNVPYAGHLPGDSIDRHALRHGRPNLLLELRQDLIETPEGQAEWGRRLAPLIDRAGQRLGLPRPVRQDRAILS